LKYSKISEDAQEKVARTIPGPLSLIPAYWLLGSPSAMESIGPIQFFVNSLPKEEK